MTTHARMFALMLALLPGACIESESAPDAPDLKADDVEDTEDPDVAPALHGGSRYAYLPYLSAHRYRPNGGSARVWTGVQAQNLSGVDTRLTLELLNADGSIHTTRTSGPVSNGSSANFIVHRMVDGDEDMPPWEGYGRLYADNSGRVEAIVNLTETKSDDPWGSDAGDSYEGTAAPESRWMLPFLDVRADADTAIWIVNPNAKPATVEVTFDSRLETITIAPGARHTLWTRDLGISASSRASGDIAATGASISSDHPIAVAVTGQRGVDSFTAYRPPTSDQSLAPLVNFQPNLATPIDTVVFAQRDPALPPGTVRAVYHRENNSTCSETVENVGPGEVVDFGWSMTARNANGPGRTSTCRDMILSTSTATDVQKRFVGWVEFDEGATGVVVQRLGLDGSERDSSYPMASGGRDASTEISFPLLQSGNPTVVDFSDGSSHYSNWSGISIVNPTPFTAEVKCEYPNEVGADKAELEPFIIPGNGVAHRQLYEVFAHNRFVGSGRCTSNQPVLGVSNQQFGWGKTPMAFKAVAIGESGQSCLARSTQGDGYDDLPTRLEACREKFPGSSVLATEARPSDSSDLEYYVNRAYSVDPCFPSHPGDVALAGLRGYVNPTGREPEMATRCESYNVPMVTLPGHLSSAAVRLRSDVWEQGFRPMFEAAAAEGISLVAISGFRSATLQQSTFAHWTSVEGGDAARASVYSAQPLHSEHQLGTTADVGYRKADGSVANPFADPVGFHHSAAGQWIRANAHRFGIVTTYQPHKIELHQYKPEPWHLRFVGGEMAEVSAQCDLSTEELLAHKYGIPLPLPTFANMHLVQAAAAADGWGEDACFGGHAGSSAFCSGVSAGGWCDGHDAVSCDAFGNELGRETCATGCCSMPAGSPDVCAGTPAASGALSCSTPPTGVSEFCATRTVGGWCDGSDAVWCDGEGVEVRRTACEQGCCSMPAGTPDGCAEGMTDEQRDAALSCG